MSEREFQVLLFGATGFTGQLVAEHLSRTYGESLRLALAGRNAEKLERVAAGLPTDPPRIVIDAFDAAGLARLMPRTAVVCTTVGPYATYGHEVVAAAAAAGTHYCDLTGETPFIRDSIDRNHAIAQRSGARIVHCCGYDSIPSDLGTWFLQRAALEAHGRPLAHIKHFAGESRGGFSGGTVASMMQLVEQARSERSVRQLLLDPYALNPEGERHGPDGPDQRGIAYHEDLGMWSGPFVMASINTRVVRRSHALLDHAWGSDFRYEEAMSTGRGLTSWLRAGALTAGMGLMVAAMSTGPGRRALRAALPSPGEGPGENAREKGYFVSRFIGHGQAADGSAITMRARIDGRRDPGYGATSRMLGESAVCLAVDPLDCPGGVRTPASTMAEALLPRLEAHEIRFRLD